MLESKIKTLKEIQTLFPRLKAKGKSIVFTNGCFDILHYGHVKYLQEAKQKGDILIVAVNADSSIRRIKGRNRPIVSEKNRVRMIAALEGVDYVILFTEVTPLKVIKAVKPDILVKGADWKKAEIAGADFVRSYGGRVLTVPLVKNQSTTNLIRKIAKTF